MSAWFLSPPVSEQLSTFAASSTRSCRVNRCSLENGAERLVSFKFDRAFHSPYWLNTVSSLPADWLLKMHSRMISQPTAAINKLTLQGLAVSFTAATNGKPFSFKLVHTRISDMTRILLVETAHYLQNIAVCLNT